MGGPQEREVRKLLDDSGRPLRLYLVDGRPATDKDGTPLVNIAGNPIVSCLSNKGHLTYVDVKGCPLTDRWGRRSEDPDYSPTEAPAEVEKKRNCEEPVFALDGHPLTDSRGVPLTNSHGKCLIFFNPKGHPVTDLEGRDVTGAMGVVLHPTERPYLSKDKTPLRIFDEIGRPLTDENGFPLTHILGYPLIANDSFRNPLSTLKGYPLKDAEGLLQRDEGFDLTKIPRYNVINKAIICRNKEPGIAFDMYGHPLTNMFGFPLFDLEGEALVRKKKIWVDVQNNPVNIIRKCVYDKDLLKNLRNSKGRPVRLYERRGYPLTDLDGTPLVNASGLLLLKFNEDGEPVSDAWDYPVFDSRNNPLGSEVFRPCKGFKRNLALEAVNDASPRGLQFYDATGMPLTSSYGLPLLNVHQELMAEFDEHCLPTRDGYGRDVFDILGLPVNHPGDQPLKGPTGAPIRLYNKSGRPLTDKYGNVLMTVSCAPMLKVNSSGRIVSDARGGFIYDADGCPINLIDKFLPTKYPYEEIWGKSLHKIDGSPIVVYDKCGEPLTDSRGGILMDCQGKPLIIQNNKGLVQERNGGFIIDSDGFTNLKVSGRALKEKVAIYDEYDRPLIGSSGFILRLRTGREIIRLDRYGFPASTFDGGKICDSQRRPLFTPLSDMSVVPKFDEVIVFEGKIQLYDCEDRPLLDINGALLFTSRGVPLIQLNKDGRPRCDALGRPIYDADGIPICSPGGVWKDQHGRPFHLYDKEHYPVTDARGKELLDIHRVPLIVRDEFGHPQHDNSGGVLYDANGYSITSSSFLGISVPPQSKTSSLMESKGVPLRLFDVTGRPLTDECGKPLETSKGKPIIDITKGINRITDLLGRTVYDSRQIPLACRRTSAIITMGGKPVVLYNKSGNPLMTSEGFPISRLDGTTLLSFDQFGRPTNADGLYDMHGNTVDSPECTLTGTETQKVSMMSLEGRPVKVFDTSGLPLTDDKGNVLYRFNGEPLRAGSWGDNPG